MTGFGSKAFTDPDAYRSRWIGANMHLVVTGGPRFSARVSWLDMRCLRLLAVEEMAPRIAFVSLPPSPLFISLALADTPPLIWNGRPLKRGEFVLHAPGDRFHHRTTGAARWGLISMPSADLAAYGRALLQAELPPGTCLLRPSARNSAWLLRVHSEADRLARSKPGLLARGDVSRALEQELIHALVSALGTAELDRRSGAACRNGEIMAGFEDALRRGEPARPLPTLSAEIGISERTLRSYCTAFLGCSPLAYARLRRLNLVRSALLEADHKATGVAEIARTHGFSESGRFSVAYRRLFGETPRATLQRDSAESA